MSIRQLRARLERVSSSILATAPSRNGDVGFAIDLALAKALRDAVHRLNELLRKKHQPHDEGRLTADEQEEERTLTASIAEMAKAIGYPQGYGVKENLRDCNRLHALWCKRLSPPACNGGSLTDAEDAEEAVLEARSSAYQESPEGRGRVRISTLEWKAVVGVLGVAEQEELDSLKALYPDLPPDPNHPLANEIEAWGRGRTEARQEVERRRQGRQKRSSDSS